MLLVRARQSVEQMRLRLKCNAVGTSTKTIAMQAIKSLLSFNRCQFNGTITYDFVVINCLAIKQAKKVFKLESDVSK